MPISQKKEIKKVLILGSGALRIGQAGEFDYSGSQALKALKEEGIESVLINPNIASIQTDKELCSKVYLLPVEPYFVEKVIEREAIDAILLSFGGQTALNCGLVLEEKGVFVKHNVKVLGTPVETIRLTEDRDLFAKALADISVKTAVSEAVYSVAGAILAAKKIGYPVMMRSGFSLGGQGSAIVHNEEECRNLAKMSFASVSQILVEECLQGWKEVEYEVVRDGSDNCITVCNMENFDPMGIHTGESIVVAPSQTLDDFEYQMLRDVAIKTIRHLGIIGECNIQYALHPESREYRVIEVNARLSRSSALASKATGYPLAYVAAKIALGYDMADIPNSITKVTTAFFEPSLDYIVCKFPRWDLKKFDVVDPKIGTEMKSVGEVMAVGRSFAEVIQKAIRMLEIGIDGLETTSHTFSDLKTAIATPTPERIFAIAQGLEHGMGVDEIYELSKIDRFFLYELERIINHAKLLRSTQLLPIKADYMREIKQAGFSDKAIAKLVGVQEKVVRDHRHHLGVRPHLSQIDTMAAEYPAETNFLYFTYANVKTDVKPCQGKSVLVLGSGCYRIGASVEFDWCAVNAVKAAQELGYEVIMLNYNPETVSTDYDNCEKLVFDEITTETVLDLYYVEKPDGLIISVGGQTPNNLALELYAEGVPIFGTSPESIDQAEDRNKFSRLLDRIGVLQPKWASVTSIDNLKTTIEDLGGFPILVRPSYVLSGAAMRIADSEEELITFLGKASDVSPQHPVTISKFEHNSREIEFDAIAHNGMVKLYAISEHIEDAGVHSGDATIVFPAQTITLEETRQIVKIGRLLAKELNITGPFNIQLLVRNHIIKVIECNLRASRSFPFISKGMNVNLIREVTRLMLSRDDNTRYATESNMLHIDHVVVKVPQFSFSRLKGADPRLGVEMASTGETACFGYSTSEALLASMIAAGFKIPKKGVLISMEREEERMFLIDEARLLSNSGLKIYATPETARVMIDNNVPCEIFTASDMLDNNQALLIDFLKSNKVDMIISVPGIGRVGGTKEGYWLRRLAIDLNMPCLVEKWLAKRIINAFCACTPEQITIKTWTGYFAQVQSD